MPLSACAVRLLCLQVHEVQISVGQSAVITTATGRKFQVDGKGFTELATAATNTAGRKLLTYNWDPNSSYYFYSWSLEKCIAAKQAWCTTWGARDYYVTSCANAERRWEECDYPCPNGQLVCRPYS